MPLGATAVRSDPRCGANTSPRLALVPPDALQNKPVMDVGLGGAHGMTSPWGYIHWSSRK